MIYRHSRVHYVFIAFLLLGAGAWWWGFIVSPPLPPPEPGVEMLVHDKKAEAMAFCVLNLLLACAAFSYQHFRRVVVDEVGIRIYGFLGFKLFDANWNHIDRMWFGGKMGQDCFLQAGRVRARIPSSVAQYGDLMRTLVTSVPMEARPVNPSPPFVSAPDFLRPLTHRGGAARDLVIGILGILWHVGALSMLSLIILMAPVGATIENNATQLLYFLVPIVLPLPYVINAWLARWHRSSAITPEGLEETNREGHAAIAWSEIVFAQVRYSPITKELIVASPWTSIAIDSSEKTYPLALTAIPRLAPPTALIVAPPAPPTMAKRRT